jgi:hypothetical protein
MSVLIKKGVVAAVADEASSSSSFFFKRKKPVQNPSRRSKPNNHKPMKDKIP